MICLILGSVHSDIRQWPRCVCGLTHLMNEALLFVEGGNSQENHPEEPHIIVFVS